MLGDLGGRAARLGLPRVHDGALTSSCLLRMRPVELLSAPLSGSSPKWDSRQIIHRRRPSATTALTARTARPVPRACDGQGVCEWVHCGPEIGDAIVDWARRGAVLCMQLRPRQLFLVPDGCTTSHIAARARAGNAHGAAAMSPVVMLDTSLQVASLVSLLPVLPQSVASSAR